MSDIKTLLSSAEASMKKSVTHTNQELAKIRAGKAMPNMLDGLNVDYYGNPTPINQVAAVNTPDGRTLLIKPWEKTMIAAIEKAIINSDLGLNPQNDGESIRITIPPLTGERRQQLVKQAKAESESGKVSIRNVRKDTNDKLKGLMKDGTSEDEVKRAEDQVQKLTDKHVKQIDELMAKKEEEITTV